VQSRALPVFRFFAYATGIALLLLVVAMVAKYVGDDDRWVPLVAPLHGWLYVGYVVSAFIVAGKLRWSLFRTIALLLAGTIPLASFVAERKVMEQVRRQGAAPQTSTASAGSPG
jgi:integral membrane protein